jgi:hypothetical protein
MTIAHAPGGHAPAVHAAVVLLRWPREAVAAVPRLCPVAGMRGTRAGGLPIQLAAARFRGLSAGPPRAPAGLTGAAAATRAGLPPAVLSGPVVPVDTGPGRLRQPTARTGRRRQPTAAPASKLVVRGCRTRPESCPAANRQSSRQAAALARPSPEGVPQTRTAGLNSARAVAPLSQDRCGDPARRHEAGFPRPAVPWRSGADCPGQGRPDVSRPGGVHSAVGQLCGPARASAGRAASRAGPDDRTVDAPAPQRAADREPSEHARTDALAGSRATAATRQAGQADHRALRTRARQDARAGSRAPPAGCRADWATRGDARAAGRPRSDGQATGARMTDTRMMQWADNRAGPAGWTGDAPTGGRPGGPMAGPAGNRTASLASPAKEERAAGQPDERSAGRAGLVCVRQAGTAAGCRADRAGRNAACWPGGARGGHPAASRQRPDRHASLLRHWTGSADRFRAPAVAASRARSIPAAFAPGDPRSRDPGPGDPASGDRKPGLAVPGPAAASRSAAGSSSRPQRQGPTPARRRSGQSCAANDRPAAARVAPNRKAGRSPPWPRPRARATARLRRCPCGGLRRQGRM